MWRKKTKSLSDMLCETGLSEPDLWRDTIREPFDVDFQETVDIIFLVYLDPNFSECQNDGIRAGRITSPKGNLIRITDHDDLLVNKQTKIMVRLVQP